MRLSFPNSPRLICRVPVTRHIHIRAINGDLLISRDQQTLLDGGGLPVAVTDGIVSLQWDAGEIWAMGAPNATVEVIVP